MPYQDDDKIGRCKDSANIAISLALNGKWQEAINLNLQIIERYPQDVDAYNRLGKAYLKTRQYNSAKEAYEKALTIDKYNIIAEKNLKRLSIISEEDIQPLSDKEIEAEGFKPQAFIEEIGKSGVVALTNTAPVSVLAKIEAGDEVVLSAQDNNLIVENKCGEYLGTVSPMHGRRLLRLLSGGNRYSSIVVGSADGYITVMIREIYQHPSQTGKLSFPAKMVEVDNVSIDNDEEYAMDNIIESLGEE